MFDPKDYPVTTACISFVMGLIGGIAIKVISDRLTDSRRHGEAKARLRRGFEACRNEMPKLIEEMAQDLINGLKYEFFIVDVRNVYGGFSQDCSLYATNGASERDYLDETRQVWVHSNLPNKLKMLENHGFIVDVTADTAPHFRMTEEFVGLLRDFADEARIEARQ
jgi:hypothetical protein